MKKTALRRVSKSPHRIEKRFVPKDVLKELEKRSGGQCEVFFWKKVGKGDWQRHHRSYKNTLAVTAFEYRCHHWAQKQPHHILKRSRGGKHTLDNLLKVCFECHRWIEDNEKEAVKYGLSLPYANYTP